VLNLLIAQMISLKRVQHSIQVLIGQILSEATILKYVWQLHQALELWEHSAIEQLLQMPTLTMRRPLSTPRMMDSIQFNGSCFASRFRPFGIGTKRFIQGLSTGEVSV